MSKTIYDTQKKRRKVLLCIVAVALIFGLLSSIVMTIIEEKDDKIVITVGSKAYTEQQILGNILAEVIETNPNYKVERKIGLGGTSICYGALKEGSIDLYAEYSAGIYLNQLKLSFDTLSKDEIYETIKPLLLQKGIVLNARLGFENDYELTVTREYAEQNNLKTIYDLKALQNDIIVAPTFEYVNREDGMLGINKIYSINFKNVSPMEAGLRYTALQTGEAHVINTFTTDGMKFKLDLVALEDPENVHMSQEAVVIVNKETFEKYPELAETLKLLEGLISAKEMVEMNYKVDVEGKMPEEVAKEFLRNKGILK